MRRLKYFAVILVVAIATIGTLWLLNRPRPAGTPVEIAFGDAHEHVGDYVRITGMAHYAAVVRQDVPGTWVQDPKTLWLWGFFEAFDTEGRAITMVVRSPEKPEHLVHYELMTVEGWLERSTPEKVPFEAEVILGKNSDYFFTDDMLLLEAYTLAPAEGS